MERKQYITPTINKRQMLLPELPVAQTRMEGSRNGNIILDYEGEDRTENGLWADSKSRNEEYEEKSLW